MFRTQFSRLLTCSFQNYSLKVNNQSIQLGKTRRTLQPRFYCSQEQTGPNIAALTNGDPDLEHKLKVLILEVDVLRQEGRSVPEDCYLKDQHWQELLCLPTISARRRFLEFQFKISKKKEGREVKKEQKRQERDDYLQNRPPKSESFEDFVHNYDLSHNNIFLRFYESTMNQMYNNRLIQAMQFGQKLVVDCGYHTNMTARENKNCAKQLMLLFAENRAHDDPFDLHYCNFTPSSIIGESLHRYISTMYEPWFPLNIEERSYTELFPKEKLVYLTPHCREEIQEYDHDAIYIIGGIVDKVNNEPLSLAKAKKEGLKMAKFPLDRHLQWSAGSGKSLTLNQVASILLDMKHTNDWKYALRHVPRRKVVDESQNRPLDRRQVWTPSKNVNFRNNSFRNKSKPLNGLKVRSIMFDEEEDEHDTRNMRR